MPGRGPGLGFLISGISTLKVLVISSHSLVVEELDEVLYIMSWTDADEDRTIPGEKEGPVSVNSNNCDMKPGQDCVYMKRNPENLDQYRRTHVVLFNSHYIKLGDLPPDRPSNQLWIVRLSESPTRTNVKTLEHMRYHFNGTISYMLNSNIKWLLAKFSWTEDTSDRSHPQMETDQAARTNLEKKISGKTRLVAWFVSHCKTPSQRERYVEELSKHISVDVFGRCGNLTCSSSSGSHNKCDRMLDSNYKFYLAFENSLCEDYVTEKFYRMFQIDIVPIVLGAADYGRFAAPGTYLDVRDFSSPGHLANHLNLLNNRMDLYMEYLLRRRPMRTIEREPVLCSVCKYAHKIRQTTNTIVDVTDVWSAKKLCRNTTDFYARIK